MTALQNVRLLRDCAELGMGVTWNLLTGFPGESERSYLNTIRLIPLLEHLSPPGACSRVRLDRFSPNYEASGSHGFSNVRPARAYRHVYCLSDQAISDIAYFFEADSTATWSDTQVQEIQRLVAAWLSKASTTPSRLILITSAAMSVVIDTRSCAKQTVYVLSIEELELLRALDRPTSMVALARANGVGKVVPNALDRLIRLGYVVEIDGKLLRLVTFDGRKVIDTCAVEDAPFGVLRAQDTPTEQSRFGD